MDRVAKIGREVQALSNKALKDFESGKFSEM